MLSAAISVAALCKKSFSSVEKHLSAGTSVPELQVSSRFTGKLMNTWKCSPMHLPPVSSSNWKLPSLFCCCCISFYWWWKFHHIPQTSVWLQTFWWFSTSGFVEEDGDVEAGGLWVCYRAESQTLQPIRMCEDDPQVSAVRKILWGYETISQLELNMWSACVWAESHFHFLSSSPHWYPSGSFKNHLEIIAEIQQVV